VLEIREFYQRIWKEYADPAHHPITARCLSTQSEILRVLLEERRPQIVLDLGCGPLPVIRPEQATLVVSADFIPEMLSSLRGKGAHRAVCLDALALPFRKRCFDLVWCGLVVDHVGEVRRWIEEILRVLKPGGVLGMACWERSHLPRERYPQDRIMRYTCSSGEELAVTSYPNSGNALEVLKRLDPNLQIRSYPVVPDQYVLQVAFAESRSLAPPAL
jgi:SAM-dependent methyltransferase